MEQGGGAIKFLRSRGCDVKDSSFDPISFLLSCFAISSLAALSKMLREGRKIKIRQWIGCIMEAGLYGLLIGLFCIGTDTNINRYVALFVCILAGFGAQTVRDHLFTVIYELLKRGIRIYIRFNGNNNG
ncbi:MAG: hypothetical protein QXQ02_00090 [Halobacteria archaeon]